MFSLLLLCPTEKPNHLQVAQLIFSVRIGDLTLWAESSLEKVGTIARDQMLLSHVYDFSEPPEMEEYEMLYVKLKKCDSGGSFLKNRGWKGNKGENCQGWNKGVTGIEAGCTR